MRRGAPASPSPSSRSSASCAAEILEQVLVKVNGDILTKTELEAKQVAALRGRINSAVDAEAMKNDETLKKMIAEVTPQDPRRHHRRDAAAAARQGKGLQASATSSSRSGRRHPQGAEPRGRREVQGGARAGRHDDGRPAAQLRDARSPSTGCSRTKSDRSCRSPRKRRGSTTSRTRRSSSRRRRSRCARSSIEIPTHTQGGEAGVNVAQDDEAQKKAEAIARAGDGRRGLRQGRRRGVELAVEGQRRPDRPAADEGAVAGDARSARPR